MPTKNERILNKNNCSDCSFTFFCTTSGGHAECLSHSLVTTTRHLARNEALCVLNNKFQNIYVIAEGAVKAYQIDIHGREHVHAFYFVGEALGYRAIHTGYYISNVVALTDTLVCEIPYNHFLELLKTKPELYQHMLALMSKQLTASAYLDSASSSAEQRVAAFIIDLSYRVNGAIPMQEVILPMNRQDIGNYLGLTAETVSRVFSRLQKNRVIIADRKCIRIANPQKLKLLAQ